MFTNVKNKIMGTFVAIVAISLQAQALPVSDPDLNQKRTEVVEVLRNYAEESRDFDEGVLLALAQRLPVADQIAVAMKIVTQDARYERRCSEEEYSKKLRAFAFYRGEGNEIPSEEELHGMCAASARQKLCSVAGHLLSPYGTLNYQIRDAIDIDCFVGFLDSPLAGYAEKELLRTYHRTDISNSVAVLAATKYIDATRVSPTRDRLRNELVCDPRVPSDRRSMEAVNLRGSGQAVPSCYTEQ